MDEWDKGYIAGVLAMIVVTNLDTIEDKAKGLYKRVIKDIAQAVKSDEVPEA